MHRDTTPNNNISKHNAFSVAILCCLPIGGLVTYLCTLVVTDFEGASGYAFVYLFLPITLASFFCIYLFKSKIFYRVIILISISVLVFCSMMFYKEYYMNKNCLKHHIKRLQEPEKSERDEFCKKLSKLLRW